MALGLWLRWMPPSHWLEAFTVDGHLEPATARFADSCWIFACIAGLVQCTAAWSRSFRAALVGTVRGALPRGGTASGWVIAALALATLVARLLVSAWSDIGLGDDGARVAWLLRWLRDPEWVPRELWAPGHLYLHALVWLVVRDAVRAGILLSALASAATVWLLGRAVQREWGTQAGVLAALLVGVLPVASAHGATPDVNPVFACLCVAAVCCVVRAARGSSAWLLCAWVCVFFASWSRFETFILAPAFAAPLWPHRRRALVFLIACLLPALAWGIAVHMAHGDALRMFRTLQVDPTLMRPLASRLFDLLWSAWLGVPLSVALLGCLGALRSLHHRRGTEFLPLVCLHLCSLAAATWSTGTGNQPRYFILAGAIAAAYAGVALAGASRTARGWGTALLVATLIGIPWTTALFPHPGELWIRRLDRVRAVADCVAAQRGGASEPVVWIADEAGYFFLCREHVAIECYHAMPRAESDAGAILAALHGQPTVLVCVRDNAESRRRWQAFLQIASASFTADSVETFCADYRLARLSRHDE